MIDLDLPWCLTDEHRAWRGALRRFADEVIAPEISERDKAAKADIELIRRAAELGVFGLRNSTRWGGLDTDITSLCLAVEEFARIDFSMAMTVHVQALGAALLEHLGNEDQKESVLPAAVRGEELISIGLTEPSGGSDAGNIHTRARRDGDDWVISGAKQFITNSGTALSRYVILFAATSEGRRGRPIVSAFLVPLDAPGVEIGRSYDKLGARSSDTHPLYFDDVRLPRTALLYEEGQGYAEALRFLTWARLPFAASAVGVAQGSLEATLAFVRDRESFGRPLTAHQAVSHRVAEIAAMTATARTVTYDACHKYDHGHLFNQEAAICKLVASELANKVVYSGTQLHGGYGFVEETMARHYRDARILTIGEGTSEVQRMLIARSLGLEE
jgi:alkylation response protein AidB-like acyl-CoA dehydrogenase